MRLNTCSVIVATVLVPRFASLAFFDPVAVCVQRLHQRRLARVNVVEGHR